MKTFTIRGNIKDCTVDKAMVNDEFLITAKGNNIEVRDEYHSFEELYNHRMALNIALFNYWSEEFRRIEMYFDIEQIKNAPPKVLKSKLHYDGTMFPDYFIVMAILPYNKQISYHYHIKHWDKFKISEIYKAPKWDGHNSDKVIERLMKL